MSHISSLWMIIQHLHILKTIPDQRQDQSFMFSLEITYVTNRFFSSLIFKFNVYDNVMFRYIFRNLLPRQSRVQKHSSMLLIEFKYLTKWFCWKFSPKILIDDNVYLNIFIAVSYQENDPGAKSFFCDWNPISSDPIF